MMMCEEEKEDCYRRVCTSCEHKSVCYNDFDYHQQVSVKQWITKKEKVIRNKSKLETEVKKTVKDEVHLNVGNLVDMFENSIVGFMQHKFNIKHQYSVMSKLKENLQSIDLLFHIDFSENYMCKYSAEAQSVHFGASREQVTLHTGVVYAEGGIKESFCTLSKSLRHDAFAIVAHMSPIIQKY